MLAGATCFFGVKPMDGLQLGVILFLKIREARLQKIFLFEDMGLVAQRYEEKYVSGPLRNELPNSEVWHFCNDPQFE